MSNNKRATGGGGGGGDGFWRAFSLVLSAILVGLYLSSNGGGSTEYCNTDHGELVLGHKMLHHNLGKEAQLKLLHWIRSGTFRKPKGEIERLLTLIHQTSAKRQRELEDMWKLEPTIDIKDAPASKVGNSIQEIAENKATKELALPNMERTWKVRFYFLQSQATRMVAAIATSTVGIESNKERARWLKDIAKEYEDLREQLVTALQSDEGCDL